MGPQLRRRLMSKVTDRAAASPLHKADNEPSLPDLADLEMLRSSNKRELHIKEREPFHRDGSVDESKTSIDHDPPDIPTLFQFSEELLPDTGPLEPFPDLYAYESSSSCRESCTSYQMIPPAMASIFPPIVLSKILHQALLSAIDDPIWTYTNTAHRFAKASRVTKCEVEKLVDQHLEAAKRDLSQLEEMQARCAREEHRTCTLKLCNMLAPSDNDWTDTDCEVCEELVKAIEEVEIIKNRIWLGKETLLGFDGLYECNGKCRAMALEMQTMHAVGVAQGQAPVYGLMGKGAN